MAPGGGGSKTWVWRSHGGEDEPERGERLRGRAYLVLREREGKGGRASWAGAERAERREKWAGGMGFGPNRIFGFFGELAILA